jgi:hypothetical protein
MMEFYDALLQWLGALLLLAGLRASTQDLSALFVARVRDALGLAGLSLAVLAYKHEEWWLLLLAAGLFAKAVWGARLVARQSASFSAEALARPLRAVLASTSLAALALGITWQLSQRYSSGNAEMLAASLALVFLAGLALWLRGTGAWPWALSLLSAGAYVLAGVAAPRLSPWVLLFDLVLAALLWVYDAPLTAPEENASVSVDAAQGSN